MPVSNAVGEVEPTASADAPKPHIPGEPGIWVLLFGDMMVFAVLFAVYLSHRGNAPELFARSQDALNRNLGAVNTLVLLTSSLIVVVAVRALRTDRYQHLVSRLLLAGFCVGSCFVVIKALEYHEKISAGITPATNDFYMYYFVLTGLHLAHVLIGLVLLLVLSRISRHGEFTRTRIAFIEGGGCFWHMVDLLWIVIFPLLFLVR